MKINVRNMELFVISYAQWRIISLNVNGLFHKLEEVRILLRESKFDLFAITETHLNEHDHDNEDLEIDNYHFF